MTDLPILSHSEAQAFALCSRLHYYQYGLGLVRKQQSVALHRGVSGHDILAKAIKAYKDDRRHKVLVETTYSELAEFMKADLGTASELATLLIGFLNFPEVEKLLKEADPVFVEEKMFLDIPEIGFTYAFTVDAGMNVGNKLELWDWKFAYDFYDADMITLMPQIPRYVGAARQLGWNPTVGRYMHIRTRKVKEDTEKYRVRPIPITDKLIKSSFADLFAAADRILELKALPKAQWLRKTTRTGNNLACKNCAFKQPCREEMQGGDASLTFQQLYEKNTRYGYERPKPGSTGSPG